MSTRDKMISDSFINVAEGPSAMVGMASACVVFLLIFVMYIQKKWCFHYSTSINLPCCDPVKTGSPNLGEAFSVPDVDSSSDSDEEVYGKLQGAVNSNPYPTRVENPHFHVDTHIEGEIEHEGGSSASSCCSSTSAEDGVRHRERRHKKAPSETNSHFECVVVMGQEPVFDLSEVQKGGPGDGIGGIQVSFAYDMPTRKLTVHLLQATEMPSPPTNVQVHIVLLPNKKQRYKSKSRQGENPQFMESFLFHRIAPEDVSKLGVRLRVYCWERLRRPKLFGEVVLSFSQVNLDLESNMWLILEHPSLNNVNPWCGDVISLGQSDSTGSSVSLHQGVAELLMGLAYSGTTGRLAVEVIKGSHFRDTSLNRAPDTYVKLCLVSSTGQEMARSKTCIRRSQPNPLFKETFIFQVALFQLADVTLMVSVFCKRPVKRKEMLGWFCLGFNSSGEEELSHWQDMRQVKGDQICRWHVLIDS